MLSALACGASSFFGLASATGLGFGADTCAAGSAGLLAFTSTGFSTGACAGFSGSATGAGFGAGSSLAWLTAAAFGFGSSLTSVAPDDFATGLPMLSRSIFPNGLYCCCEDDSSRLSARLSLASGARFLSLVFFWSSLSASFLTAASCLNASTSAEYCASLIFDVSSSFSSPISLLFSRNSTAV